MELFCRRFVLRNCGRFLHISSDFGSKYKTHLFVTSEALYAGMTREMTRKPKMVDIKEDVYDFYATYDIAGFPVWFTPGIFVEDTAILEPIRSRKMIDVNTFNVMDEDYPGTGSGKKRHSSPTYGTMESILPGNYLVFFGFSTCEKYLSSYQMGSVYMLGKKRTMCQIVDMSPVCLCDYDRNGDVYPVQIDHMQINDFSEYTIHAVTMRYMLVSGLYKKEVVKCRFSGNGFEDGNCIPAQEYAFPLAAIPEALS
ncbi:MAG: hypothetical protein PWP48_400 [Clostridiales bacterium]|nr:hypothetical protein [Clostridiales bacterium]MDK2991167.1 hypothetical protein [Clostridiales bacterium]